MHPFNVSAVMKPPQSIELHYTTFRQVLLIPTFSTGKVTREHGNVVRALLDHQPSPMCVLILKLDFLAVLRNPESLRPRENPYAEVVDLHPASKIAPSTYQASSLEVIVVPLALGVRVAKLALVGRAAKSHAALPFIIAPPLERRQAILQDLCHLGGRVVFT